MTYRVLVIEGNDILRQKFIDTCNEHIKLHVMESCITINSSVTALKEQEFDVIVIGSTVVDSTSLECIDDLIKVKPLPILYVPVRKAKMLEYPKVLSLGFVDTVEVMTDMIESQYDMLKLPKLVAIKAVILAKLNLNKFKFQIGLYLKDEYDHPFVNRYDNKSGKDIGKKIDRKIIKKILSNSGRVTSKDVIVIGASTGGPKILTDLISQFPKNFPPVIVVQHMPRGFIDSFSERINRRSKMKVKTAKHNERIYSGHVYIAQGGHHLEIELDNKKHPILLITDGASINFVKPSVDVTLFSAARVWGSGVISVVLTGMGHDGRAGTRVIKNLGGRSIAQSEKTSVIYGMNKSIIEAGLADKICDTNEIVVELAGMLGYQIS